MNEYTVVVVETTTITVMAEHAVHAAAVAINSRKGVSQTDGGYVRDAGTTTRIASFE